MTLKNLIKRQPLAGKGYAIVDKRGRLLLFDHRLPLYWIRRLAKERWQQFGMPNSRVVRVNVYLEE